MNGARIRKVARRVIFGHQIDPKTLCEDITQTKNLGLRCASENGRHGRRLRNKQRWGNNYGISWIWFPKGDVNPPLWWSNMLENVEKEPIWTVGSLFWTTSLNTKLLKAGLGFQKSWKWIIPVALCCTEIEENTPKQVTGYRFFRSGEFPQHHSNNCSDWEALVVTTFPLPG